MEVASLFDNLALGFSVAVSLQNLFWCLIGAIVGTAIGVLPGVGPVATMALLLPATYFLPPEGALIMLAGIYYGAQYGGSTTAILVNLPGDELGRHLPRRLPDGAPGPRRRRRSPSPRSARSSPAASPPCDRRRRAAADQARPAVRAGGLFLADGARPGHRGGDGARLDHQGARHGLPRHAAGHRRHRREYRQHALHLRHRHLFDGIDFVPIAMGVFGIDEIMANLTNSEHRDLVSSQGHRPDADQGGPQALDRADPARHVPGRAARHPARRRRGAGLVRVPTRWRRSSRTTPEQFGTGMIEGVAGSGVRQQRRRADLVHPDADAGHPLQRGDGDDGRRHDDPRHRPRDRR